MFSRAMSTLVFIGLAAAATTPCVGTVSSLDDVGAAVKCTTVNINGFTVPAGEGFTLSLASGSTVNLNGDILFGNKSWAGPLFTISGTDITFNGNGHTFDGGGPFYWDGLGSNGGTEKPRPMMKIKISGSFANVNVVNSPAQTFSVSNPGPLVIDGMNIDNSQGDLPNAQSNGLPAGISCILFKFAARMTANVLLQGHNTDGFDASTTDLTIQNSVVHNQDDCLAINKGSNIVISGNTVVNNDQALRIKMDATATGSTVTNITYSGNTGTGLRLFGVLIDQSYPDTLKTPGSGVILSDVSFTGATTQLSVNSGADRVAVNCGAGACTGAWDWSSLEVTGGAAGPLTTASAKITGFTQ
ncbi:endo-polygalacturonase [Punctularia strigosozonata HHB-11173 SS5]|uniref:endo-polygalacturonase n=1 Tax=Punctularia strigosozonata (strain HHB-11173) TaxID=741275 RepID=UPI000441854B|nr:endo-polygalacturonase [Punctularia strigosozonata HHB-11173 SS5]EIN11876.1 endo-polygalacturonase [Punctularia strigosozonata HHB-11173 SS5]